MKKLLFSVIVGVFMSGSAFADGPIILSGSTATVGDDAVGVVVAADTIQTLDQWLHTQDKDQKTMQNLLAAGHLIPVKSGTKIEIEEVNTAERACLVRISGTNSEVWLIYEFIKDFVPPKD